MIKRTILILLILSYTQIIHSMNPGPPILVKCPHCGNDKELMSLLSGNTFNSTAWSDTYRYSPMLPRLSPVQKCLHCNSYFMMPDEKPRYKEDESGFNYSFDTGRLKFSEIKEALFLLEEQGLNRQKEIALRLEFLYRFNDAFREFGEKSWDKEENPTQKERNETDWKLHRDNLLKLIDLYDKTDDNLIPVIAEFYREAGMFEEALKIAEGFKSDSDFLNEVMNKIKEKALAKDDKVFELK